MVTAADISVTIAGEDCPARVGLAGRGENGHEQVFEIKREVSEGWDHGGLIEFGIVDWRVGWLAGLWRFGGLWSSSRELFVDLRPSAACSSEGPAGSSAVRAAVRDPSSVHQC